MYTSTALIAIMELIPPYSYAIAVFIELCHSFDRTIEFFFFFISINFHWYYIILT